jgi:hypothetical protein
MSFPFPLNIPSNQDLPRLDEGPFFLKPKRRRELSEELLYDAIEAIPDLSSCLTESTSDLVEHKWRLSRGGRPLERYWRGDDLRLDESSDSLRYPIH